jgi:hypothetical protein
VVPGYLRLVGFFFIFALVSAHWLAYPIAFLGLFLLLGREGFAINKDGTNYRDFVSLLGVSLTSWKKLPEIKFVEIRQVYAKKFGGGYQGSFQHHEVEHLVILVTKEMKIIKVYSSDNEDRSRAIGQELIDLLGVKLNISTARLK